jgi:outer membrane protein with beta-barrel domain
MQRSFILALLALLLAAPSLMAQGSYNHVEVGIFADYFNLSRTDPHINFVGLGGRAGFNVRSNVQIEAEMAYDFKRNFTTTFSDGVTSKLVDTRLRTLHALFGPKFATSGGPVRFFGTFKAGLINFSVSDQNAGAGFRSAIGDVTTGNTAAAIYPGVGLEGFLGPIGLRADVGDEIYFKNGTHNNLRVTFGPTIRF